MRKRRLSRAPALHGDGRHSAREARIRRNGRVRLRVEIVEALGCVPRDVRLVQTHRPAQARSIVSGNDSVQRQKQQGRLLWLGAQEEGAVCGARRQALDRPHRVVGEVAVLEHSLVAVVLPPPTTTAAGLGLGQLRQSAVSAPCSG